MPRDGGGTPGGRRWFRRPEFVFVFVTFLVSYGLGFPLLFLVGASTGLDPLTELYLGRSLVVFGPTCGALVAVRSAGGLAAVTHFLGDRIRLLPQHLPIVAALPFAALGLALLAYAAAGVAPQRLAAVLLQTWPLLLAHLALQIGVVGLGEELGWRGWLLPRLAERQNLGRATLATGLIWYFWHFPILLGGFTKAFWFALAIAGLSLAFSLLWLRSQRSAVLPIVAHGSVNAPVFFFNSVLPGADHELAWSFLCGFLGVVGVVLLVSTRKLWRTPAASVVPQPFIPPTR